MSVIAAKPSVPDQPWQASGAAQGSSAVALNAIAPASVLWGRCGVFRSVEEGVSD
jgi:hypothetical protein